MSLDLTEHAIAEFRRLLGELDGAIDRQRKRVARLQASAQPSWPKSKIGDASKQQPVADEQALLAELLENRRMVQATLSELEAELLSII